MEIRTLTVLLAIGLLATSCKEETGPEPHISGLRVEPVLVKEFADTVIITFEYYDHDGDLGNPDPDQPSLSIKDSRLQYEDLYHIQPLAPVGEQIPIKGTLAVRLNNLFILGNDTVEQLQFTVMIQDRQGHWSEPVESDTITVFRP